MKNKELDIENIKNCCLVCLKIKEPRYSCKKKLINQKDSPSIYKAISFVVNIEVIEKDDYPDSICKSCLISLVEAYNFVQEYKISEYILSDRISSNVTKTNKKGVETTKDCENHLENHVETQEEVFCEIACINKEEALDNADSVEDLSETVQIQTYATDREDILQNDVPVTVYKTYTYDDLVGSELLEKNELSSEDEPMSMDELEFIDNENNYNDCPGVNNEASSEITEQICFEIEPIVEIDETTISKVSFECEDCGKKFTSRKRAENHLSECGLKAESYLCQICGYFAKNRTTLYNHNNLKHKEKKYVCDVCGKKYFNKNSLNIHLAVHENKRQFRCKICNKGFNYPIALEYHMRIHNNEKKYQCHVCDKSFRIKCALERHLRTHTGDRPYRCQYCDRALRSKGELDCHEWTHTGYRPYHCTECKKGFTKTHNLKLHMLRHSGPHECSICNKGFLETKYLKLHMKLSHQVSQEQPS